MVKLVADLLCLEGSQCRAELAGQEGSVGLASLGGDGGVGRRVGVWVGLLRLGPGGGGPSEGIPSENSLGSRPGGLCEWMVLVTPVPPSVVSLSPSP